MVIETPIEKSDLIIECACLNLKIPLRCSKLIKQGYADKVIFTGGLGKLTQNEFKKSEAEIFKEALKDFRKAIGDSPEDNKA